ncbi:YggS family pyridoxal phosphate-dependent enzyme [Lewinella cohaerens]|uniref:YggS family pyridoxal phosphate-dependent enzyme n=1 Tax=Lewinella cohaerens TaxID=70995 RepID=UPI0003819357|nr:YggS family pyridoxal phosphate-dependent enzyme [Lewinella cohaerens]
MLAAVLQSIQEELAPYQAKLVAVSKTYPKEMLQAAYECGQRDFGENRVQEIVEKAEALPKDIVWHFIGHLQTNKVKYIAPFVNLIHAVDSFKLLKEIDKRAAANDRIINVLLQFKIAEEDSKYGYDAADIFSMLDELPWQKLQHVRIVGVMGMATFTEDKEQVDQEFSQLKIYFDRLKATYFENEPSFKEISMGMSGDYPLALEHGSTMVRIGSKIFGHRG